MTSRARPHGRRERAAARAETRQLDQSDCGAACLRWVVRYFGGEESLEQLRILSGTTADGVTLLGVHQAAETIGLQSEAYRAHAGHLDHPGEASILHVVMPGPRQHFVVCFGRAGDQFLVGDPAIGLVKLTRRELDEIWRSKALIRLRPGPRFITRSARSAARWKWLVDSVRADARPLTVATILGIGISALGLALAIFSRELIDDILPRADATKLTVGLALLALTLLVQATIGAARHLVLLRQARSFSNRVTGRFLGDLLRLPYSFFNSRKTGDLIARLNDAERLQQAVTHVLGGLIVHLLMLTAGVAFIYYMSPAIAGAVVVVLAAFVAVVWRFHRPVREGQQRVMAAHSVNQSGYVEAIQAIESIKSANAEGLFMSLMRETYRRLQTEVFHLGSVGVRFAVVVEVTGSVLLVGSLAWSSVLVIDGTIGTGALVAIAQMVGMIVPSARALATANVDLQEATVAFERIHQLTSMEPEYNEPDERLKSRLRGLRSLELRKLSFRYPGRPALFADVSFRCERGQLVVIAGRTGSGKSSLLRVLQRLMPPETGTVLVNGCEWTDFSIESWRDVVAAMPQHVHLVSGTVVENLRFGCSIEPESVIARCESLGLGRHFCGLAGGYFAVVGDGGVSLSGGQRQMVGVVRALIRPASLILLDEPTSSMDLDAARAVADAVDAVRSDKIVIVASHSDVFTERADRVYFLEDGGFLSAPPSLDRARRSADGMRT